MYSDRNFEPISLEADNLAKFFYDGHDWEIGYFGSDNNGYNAYGFRQDKTIIRVTSKYEAELIYHLFMKI